MPVLFFSNADIKFSKKLKKLTWKSNDIAEVLSITDKIELINKKEFAKPALDENSKTFVMYIAALKVSIVILIYLFKVPLIQ